MSDVLSKEIPVRRWLPAVLVVVVVDPHGKPIAEPLYERKGCLLVTGASRIGGKRDVENDDPPWKSVWLGQFTGRSVGQVRENTHVRSMWPPPLGCNSRIHGSLFFKPMPW